MERIKEFGSRYGVSVRTLHYYHKIGILVPAALDDKDQRWYGQREEDILEQILRYKEMEFTLSEIREFLKNGRNEDDLKRQKDILLAKIKRIEKSIARVDELLAGDKGGRAMSTKSKKMDDYDRLREEYRQEAKERYGHTEAYRQSEERTKSYTKADWNDVEAKTAAIFRKFSEAREAGEKPEDVSHLVEEWRDFISCNFYDCTREILEGLGELYLADERFKDNLDAYGEGTAEFISQAIMKYVNGNQAER